MTKWTKLSSRKEYKAAMNRIDQLIDVKKTDVLQNELLLLAYLIEEYEQQHTPMPDAQPHEVIRYALNMRGLKQKDLIPILGSKSNVSKILSGSVKLGTNQLSALSSFLKIPVESLIPKYITESSNANKETSVVLEPLSFPQRKNENKRGRSN